MTQAITDLPLFSQADRETAARDRVLDSFEELRADYLRVIRLRMESLYWDRVAEVGRENAFVSPDDARAFLENELNPPDDLSRSFMAAVFRPSCWKPVGWTFSETPGSHRNRLRTYRFTPRGRD